MDNTSSEDRQNSGQYATRRWTKQWTILHLKKDNSVDKPTDKTVGSERTRNSLPLTSHTLSDMTPGCTETIV